MLPSTSRYSKWSLPSRFSDKNYVKVFISHLSHSCYMPYLSQIPSLITLIIFDGSVHVMKFLIMQSSPASHHFLPLRSEYSAQHPVLRHAQPMPYPYKITLFSLYFIKCSTHRNLCQMNGVCLGDVSILYENHIRDI